MSRAVVDVDVMRDVAMQTAYLMNGYSQAQHNAGFSPLEPRDKPAVSAFQEENGHIATVDRLTDLAVIVHEHLQTPRLKRISEAAEWPGVFEYEVTEELGDWFFTNSYCMDDEFREELQRKTEEFLK